MTKLSILSAFEQRQFDAPPKFNSDDRFLHFSLTKNELMFINKIRLSTHKIGFLLQLGYFKANGKFFTVEQFSEKDVEYVAKMLRISPTDIDLSSYKKKTPSDHRQHILTLQGWHSFNNAQQQKIIEHLEWLIQKQLSPRQILLSVVDFCWQNKIELPSSYILSTLITDAYNYFEQGLINILATKLTPSHREKLDQLINTKDKKPMGRPVITLLKQINQALRPSDIEENVKSFEIFRDSFYEFQPILKELNLSDQATEYFSTWMQKATAFQLNQFNNKNKLYLYLLCFIKHNFYFRHDVLIDIFLKSVSAASNAADKKLHQLEKENRVAHNKAIRKLSKTSKDSRDLIEKITEIIKSPVYSESGKLSKIEAYINQYHEAHDALEKQHIMELEKSLSEISNNQIFFNALESLSFKLQRKVSAIVKVLQANPNTSSADLIEAISYFKGSELQKKNSLQTTDFDSTTPTEMTALAKQRGVCRKSYNPPVNFLNANEKEVTYLEGKLRIPLYKILLFTHMKDAVKSGNLNFLYSYRYKAIQDYLIEDSFWKLKKQDLLRGCGLYEFEEFNKVIRKLKKQLEDKYQAVNKQFLKGKNTHITLDKVGKVKISTPKTDSDETQYISSILSQSGFVPILQVLLDINKITQFTSSFKHFSHKHTKMKPEPKTIFAGIVGKGCNIGINRIANISIGISDDTLRHTVNWCFSLKNIQNANTKVIGFINKLFIANAFRYDFGQLHTSSDGRKVNVAADSLLANYSFKYFGKSKGVSIYTFLDERHLLFHSTVISSSEREAAYVIDGLLQNEVIKSNIHSTDTHGFTETIFAATHFIGTAFAPRIKNIGDQKIYAFSARHTYENRGYKIVPSRTINLKLIEDSWDDVLRFMVTIKLKHTSASQLFKRLSSYAKDHPLYKALKEFGRIIKSIFILTYLDDVELRQRIEKQLNKVELSNKFSKAVFFANNQEFKQGTKEEQEIATACKVLIQNIIVLWNYLYLSQRLASNDNIEERIQMIELIKRGSIIIWHHINLQGEYDFTKHTVANDNLFNMEQILALKAV